MAINKHSLYGVFLNDGGVTDVFIGGITAQTINTGSEISSDPVSDNVYAQYQGLIRMRPTALFSTLALKTALDAIGVSGMDVATGGSTDTGVDYFVQKHSDGGTREGTTSHIKYATTDGLIIPQTLTASGQGDAILTYQHIITSPTAATLPVVKTSSVTLPTDGSSSHLERFALGPIKIESYVLTGVRSMTIDFGIQVEVEHEGSDVFPTFKGITAIQPVITFTGIDPNWLDNNAGGTSAPELEGGAVSHANTTIYLRKRDQTGFVADGSDVHIKMTAAGTFIIDTPVDATTNAASELTGRLICEYDGTNTPIKVVSTAVAIT